METIVVQPLFFLFCTGIVVPVKQSDASEPTPCEKPLTEKNVVKAIQKELDRDGGYTDANGDHPGMDLGYHGGRYLDHVVGMWISMDKAEQYVNSYSYCGGNPVGMVDSDGNEAGVPPNPVTASFAVGIGIKTMWDVQQRSMARGDTEFQTFKYGLGAYGISVAASLISFKTTASLSTNIMLALGWGGLTGYTSELGMQAFFDGKNFRSFDYGIANSEALKSGIGAAGTMATMGFLNSVGNFHTPWFESFAEGVIGTTFPLLLSFPIEEIPSGKVGE